MFQAPIARRAAITYGLGDIMDKLGQRHTAGGRVRSLGWQLRYVALLITDHSFPAPLPLMTGPDPRPGSRWVASAVDAWFADRAPPGCDAIDPGAERAAANDMDASAAVLARRFQSTPVAAA